MPCKFAEADSDQDADDHSLGSPGDLEELDDCSSNAVPETSSDVSSAVVRTMDGTKLGRVIDQLKAIMIKSPDSSGSTTTPDSKGESFVVLSSDDEKEADPTTTKKPLASPAARGGSTVGEYLKREKAKHLAKQNNNKMDKPENPHVLPKSVS